MSSNENLNDKHDILSLTVIPNNVFFYGLWCLTPLSTIFHPINGRIEYHKGILMFV
jgi:hypothetical protein